MSKHTIAVASDPAGFSLKQAIVEHLSSRTDVNVLDFGMHSEDKPEAYFDLAAQVARAIQDGKAEKAILLCGTGQGMAIVANKHKGIYACLVTDVFSGERCKIINNANVITLGGWITAPFVAKEIIDGWLAMSFMQKMECKKDFLTNAFKQVQAIEERNFRS